MPKKRVLIVEDDAKNCLLEHDLLEVAGFEVLTAENGATGLAVARREKPDAILLDLRLPDIRGSIVATTLRQSAETCAIPIIFVTASLMTDETKEIQAIGNCGIISKPIDTRTFAKEIEGYLR